MRILEDHRTPDKLFRFLVWEEDGDVTLGFEGFQWHTHADVLSGLSGLSESEAVREFINDLITGKSVIAIEEIGSEIREVWVAESPFIDKYKPDDAVIRFRRWNGDAA